MDGRYYLAAVANALAASRVPSAKVVELPFHFADECGQWLARSSRMLGTFPSESRIVLSRDHSHAVHTEECL